MPQSIKQELIELLLTEPVSNREITNQGNYVEVINRARPQGFAEKFALLLEETPTIHSPLKPEFFLHFFLGSVLTLPNTALMSKVNIEEILFKLDKENFKSVKLVFKIRGQFYYQYKFIIINTSSDTENIGFTGEELAEIRSKMGNLEMFFVDGQILHIVKDKGFKLKVLDEQRHKSFGMSSSSSADSSFIQVKKDIVESIKIDKKIIILKDFEPLLDRLSDNVQQGVECSFALLKKIYQGYAELGTSESAYHGFMYGFFRLNYKYKYALDCYVERIAGKGYADIMLLSRKISDNKDKVKGDDDNKGLEDVVSNKNQNIKDQDKKQFIPVIVEVKARIGADIAIEQINESGYIYNLPNIRTNADKAVIVGIDFNTEDTTAKVAASNNRVVNELMVKSTEIKKFEQSLSSQLVQDIVQLQANIDSITRHIKDQIEHLYYASIRSKDHHYLSRVLLGEVFTLKNDDIKRHVFIYDKKGQLNPVGDKVTTIILQQDKIEKGIILNIIEGSDEHQTRFRGNNQDNIFTQDKIIPVEQLGIKDAVIVNIAVNPQAAFFANKLGNSYLTSESIKIENIRADEFVAKAKYSGRFQEIAPILIDDLIKSIYGNADSSLDSDDLDKSPVRKRPKKLVKELQEILSSSLKGIKELIKQEVDVQLIIAGMFMDQFLANGKHLKTFAEITFGSGRGDLAIFIIDENFDEDRPIIIECKYGNNAIISDQQVQGYIQYLKHATEHTQAVGITLILDPNKENKFVQVEKSFAKIDHTSHSSHHEANIAVQAAGRKQKHKIQFKNSDLAFLKEIGIDLDVTVSGLVSLNLSVRNNNKILTQDNFDDLLVFLAQNDVSALKKKIELNLAGNIISEYERVDELFELLGKNHLIKSLNLSNTGMDKTYIHKLIQQIIIFEIENIDISNNNLDSESVKILSHGFAKLDVINLSSNPIGNAGLESITLALQQHSLPRVLKLSDIDITVISNNLLEILRDQRFIRELDISNNSLDSSETAKLLKTLTLREEQGRIKKDGKLKLNLSGNKITGTALEELKKFIATSSVLNELNISNTGLGDDGLKYVVDGLNNNQKHLKLTLDISTNKISRADILFEHLNPNTHKHQVVRNLIIANNNISNVQELSTALMTNNELQSIDLSNNKITYAQAGYIFDVLYAWSGPRGGAVEEYDGNKVVKTLILNDNPIEISDKDVESTRALIYMLRYNNYLSHLGFAGLNIDDNCLRMILDHLQENTSLDSIDLSSNKIELSAKRTQDKMREFLRENVYLTEFNFANNKIIDVGGKLLIGAFLEEQVMLKKAKRKDFMDLDLSDNPTLGKEFIHTLLYVIRQDQYPLETLRLANNGWSKELMQQLINSITNNKEKLVNIDLSGNEISPSARSKLNTYQLKYSLGVLDDDDDDISIIQACLPSTSRHKREIHECKIGWDDVDKISNGQTRNSDELVIDSKKFLEYSKQHTEDGIKSLQLVRLAEEVKSKGDGKIVGKYQGLLEQVIQDKGYKNYLQQKRIDAIGHYVIDRDSYSISPELKLKLINAAGKIQLIRGMHGLVVSCQEGAGSDCALSVSGLGYSFLSQPIENMMVKAAPRIINNAAHVSSHIAPRILSYDTKFMVRVFGGKYATKLAKGGAGVIASIFDIVDIGISANALIECNKRADSNNVCSDKEIRDNIASISFASIAFVSSVTLTAMGAGPAAVVVGFVIMVGQGIYTGISTIIEYEEKYNTTLSENMEIFFHSFFFMSPPRHVEHLAARTRYVNDTVLYAWEELTNLPDNIVAYAIGLGEVEFRNIQPYREMILAVPVFCPRGIKNCSPDIIYEQHKVYNPGTIVAPTFKPAYAMIDMSREDTLHIRAEFSRVLPTPIQNSNMICLPKISEQEYELHKQNHLAWNVLACLNVPFCMEITYNVNVMILKNDQKQYVPISKYDCNNAVVLEHALRMNLDFKNKSIVYNLQNVNAGTIFGSHKLNNIFLVFEGNTQIFGGTGSNELIIFRDKYNGSIYLNSSTNAIIDVSKLSSNVINMKYYDQYMIITTDQGIFRINELENTEIKYVGRPNKVDKIVCNQLFKLKGQNIDDDKEIKQNNIIIDSGGGINRARKDTIQDCNKLIVSPNTEVTASDYGNYYFYIKSNDYIKYYTEQQAASWIDILGRATIIFSEISLLEDDTKIKYDTINNNLVIKIPLAQNGWYKLLLSNYLQNDHSTNYVLINKYGSNIIPRLDKLKANDDVKYFTIYADIGRRVQQAEIFNYYKKITYTKHNYNIFTILKNENNELLKFGSAGADIIINDDNTILMSGREGADVYVITQMKYLELYISNESQDLELDILKMPLELPGIPIIRHDSDLVLGIILGMKVIILDYFASKEYQHIALMDVDNNLYIPLELGEEIRLVPFCHKSFSKNVFILTSNVGHAVIDIDEDNIVLYKQGSDLLITEKESRFNSSNSLNIILKEYYYQDKQQWLDTKLYRYNNATSIIIDLHKMKISEISYQEYYDSIIKEYIVDLSKGFKYICYNLTDQLMPVEPSEERIGIVIFENTPLKRLVVSEIGPYYTFKDKLYDNLLIIGPWRNNPKYQISFFEFDNGLELERINVSNKTIDRIKLNNAIDRKIGKIDNNIVKAVIDYLKLSCSKYNEQNILSEKLRYNFLEEELNYRVGDSNNQNSNLEEVRKYLNSANNISGEAFMWLVVKSYNELLLKYPDIEQKSLHKIDDSCFGTVLSSSIIKKMIEYLNASASFYDIKQYLNDNKQDVQKISELLSTSDLNNHHKHRHHHGENYHREAHHNKNITAHHRGRRDIEDRLSKISEESNSDDMRVFVSDDNIVLSSSSSLKPLGYNIVNWLRDKLNSLNLNPITQVKNWFNVDDAKEQARIDWDFVDNLSYQDNNLCELNADYANGRKLLGLGYKVEQSSSRLIGDEESSIINGINYNLLDKQGNLLLLDLLLRKQTGIKYNNKGAMLVSNNDEYAKYAHSLAYSSYASVEEHQEELELLGVN